MNNALERFGNVTCDLGEGPVWSPEDGILYWHDVTARKLYAQAPGEAQARAWDLPKMPGCLALRRGGGMIFAFRNLLGLLDMETGAVEPIEGHGIDFASERFNDGACDRKGRFWAGTFDPAMKTDRGSLYRIDPDLRVHRIDTGINMSNGLAWSPDDKYLYYSDSRPGRIYRYTFDLDAGSVGPREVFLDYADRPGRPDGCTVDAEGHLWVAEVTASRISRYRPDATLDRSIELPVSKPTSVAFGGPNLRTLFITTMRYGLGDEELAREPLAGAVLTLATDVPGQPEPQFQG